MGTYGTANGLALVTPAAGQAGQLLGLLAGEVQAYFDSDGKLKAGGGVVVLDAQGVQISAPVSYADPQAFKFIASDGTVVGGLYAKIASQITQLQLVAAGGYDVYDDAILFLGATTPAGVTRVPQVQLYAVKSGGTSYFLQVDGSTGLATRNCGFRITGAFYEVDVDSGDPQLVLDTQGADKFTLGVDDSDADKFKINAGSTLADSSLFEMDSSGVAAFSGTVGVANATAATHALNRQTADGRYWRQWDNVLVVDRNGGAAYTTLAQAIAAISAAGDAAANNPYTIWLMAGTYDEDATLPDYVSLKGQGFYATILDGTLTIGSGCHVEDLRIYPTGTATTAIITNPVVDTCYLTNVYAVVNYAVDAAVHVLRHTGSTDARVYSSFFYARNTDTGSSAKAVVCKHAGSGDIELHNTHCKTSVGSNSKSILAWNAAAASGADIIVTGSWSAFGDSTPIGADNDNASGQIKLALDFENDAADATHLATEGSGVVMAPTWVGPLKASGDTELAAGLRVATLVKSAAYTLTASDYIVLANASGGAFTLTLPAAASHTGRVYRIIKTDSSANAVTVDGNGSETISGALTLVIGVQYSGYEIACDGTGWHITGCAYQPA